MALIPHLLIKPRSCFVPFLLTMLVYANAGVGGPYCTAAEPQAGLPKQIQSAAEMKTRAEESAADLKKAYSEKKVSEKNYTKARSLYVDARAAIDGWVTALQTEIEQGRDPAKSDGYSESLQTAAGKAETFIAYAQGLFADDPKRGTLIIGDIVKVLGDSGVQIWKESRSAKEKQKEALVRRLEGLKWQPFDAIKTSAQ